jgi:hypothetical protein
MTQGHSGLEVLPALLDAFKRYNIFHKIGYITSDNHGANDTLNSHLSSHLLTEHNIKWHPIQHRGRCLGHIINLAAQVFMTAGSKKSIDDVNTSLKHKKKMLKRFSQTLQTAGKWLHLYKKDFNLSTTHALQTGDSIHLSLIQILPFPHPIQHVGTHGITHSKDSLNARTLSTTSLPPGPQKLHHFFLHKKTGFLFNKRSIFFNLSKRLPSKHRATTTHLT